MIETTAAMHEAICFVIGDCASELRITEGPSGYK